MKTEYTLIVTKDNLILVSDEPYINGDKVFDTLRNYIWVKSETITCHGEIYKKIIAQSPNIKLSKELANEFGWSEVEQLACETLGYDYNLWLTLHKKDKGTLIYYSITKWIEGFQKAQELNKNKYSEEDMEKCHFHGWFQRERLEMLGKPTYSYPSNWKDMDYEERESWFFEKFIQSQQREYKVNVIEENGVFNVSKINEYK
jgi:hypothetical protein